jgi:hypothetical protein
MKGVIEVEAVHRAKNVVQNKEGWFDVLNQFQGTFPCLGYKWAIRGFLRDGHHEERSGAGIIFHNEKHFAGQVLLF